MSESVFFLLFKTCLLFLSRTEVKLAISPSLTNFATEL